MAECTAFRYMDNLVGKKESYKMPNQLDVFPSLLNRPYDDALTRVRSPINKIMERHYKSGNLTIEEAANISEGTTSDCPESRRYGLELVDTETEGIQYGLVYQEGRVLSTIGTVPEDAIVAILRREGAWEGIPEPIKDIYRRLKKRIVNENKKIARWEKERENIRKKKELTKEDEKKIRALNTSIEKSYRIIRNDENRIKQLEEQYSGIEVIIK